jgi:uncharacterized protein
MININTFFLDELYGNNYPVNIKKWKLPAYERNDVDKIKKFVSRNGRFVVTLHGFRKTGKTTMSRQISNHLQQSGKNICYFSFERKSIQNIRNLEVVLDFFINENSNSCICLDEACSIKGWMEVIKKYYLKSKSSFILTGSFANTDDFKTSSFVKDTKNFKICPPGFDEFLEIKGLKNKKYYIDFPNPVCSNIFREYITSFLERGSFPDLYNIEDRMLINEYIKTSVIEKIIYEDIPALFNIRENHKLLEIYNYLTYHSGDFIYEKSFAELTNLSEPTVDTFINYLELFDLFNRVYTESNINKSVKRKKKGFLTSASLYYNTASNFSSASLYSTAVFEKIRSLNPVIYIDRQIHEVDFIVNTCNKIYPFVVKAVDMISPVELNNLVYLLKRKNLDEGYCIYKGDYKLVETNGKKIHLIPLSTFLASELSFV